jgi:2'-5' RNA ligase
LRRRLCLAGRVDAVSCVKTRRLFVGLWPQADVCSDLAEYMTRTHLPADAKRVAPEEWHVTLEFLGVVPETARPSIERLLADFPSQPEPLVLDRLEYWPDSRAGVLVPARVPTALHDAQAWLRTELQALGLRVDDRPFRPHLTLYRGEKAPAGEGPVPPIVWPLRRVALVESSPAVGSPRYLELSAQELS